jgi:20S proteasome alpha/beta subunit
MTLIAAFRCSEGVVLCADSQETVGDVRVAVNKVAPDDAGEYQIAIAGSGNGDLIDGFAYALKLDVQSWPDGLDEKVVYGNLQTLLQEYYEHQVAFYPVDSPGDTLNHFLVCIKPKKKPVIFLWELRGTAVVPVADYTLLGVGASIYRHELKRLYKKKLSGLQAVLLGVHLFSLAKETSNYVGGQTDVIFVNHEGMWVHDPNDVRELERRMATFNEKIAELVLACPDTSIHRDEFKALLQSFEDQAIQLREQNFKAAFLSGIDRSFAEFPNYKGAPYASVADLMSVELTEKDIAEHPVLQRVMGIAEKAQEPPDSPSSEE